MLVSFYVGTSKGMPGYLDIIIRKFLRGEFSHLEVTFESADGVGHLMPDKSCETDDQNRQWCASSTFVDKMPEYSKIRKGRQGGVRFKRIDVHNANWVTIRVDADPVAAANWFVEHEGSPYAIREIFNHALPIFSYVDDHFICSRAVAEALGFKEGFRFDPCNLYPVLQRLSIRMLLEPTNL